jgi:hypothetical protein
MKLRLLSAVVGLAMATGAAHAQIGIYGTPIVSRISTSTPDTGPFAFLGDNSTSRIFTGFGLGVYDDFIHSGRLEAGVDLHGSLMRGANAHLNNFLVGVRAAYNPAGLRFKPYAQASIGVGGSRAATNPVYVSKVEYGVAGGVDYSIRPHLDFRVIEIGIGSVQGISSAAVNGSGTIPSFRLLNFSTGLVFRIP